MLPHEAAAQAAIRAVYAEPILYTGGALVDEPLTAVPSEGAAEAFQGAGSTLRERSFEIEQSLIERPRKGDIIVHRDNRWSVNDVTRRADIGAWVLIVEKAPAP